MSDEELNKEAEEFCKQFKDRKCGTLTIKAISHFGCRETYTPLYLSFIHISWFFRTFEQDRFDYHLCLN